jgi:hypothetical protein
MPSLLADRLFIAAAEALKAGITVLERLAGGDAGYPGLGAARAKGSRAVARASISTSLGYWLRSTA